ncbi:cell division protein FtsL [uncultured Limnohabitans sp.]|jgi:cell division protein FtsL|uniref:cell division protein FtsL n=1 Tax=uncultured Limnohabitans sp. TaxID=768543 RepID=UPI0026288279|nr:cell division protein FtsL [uncultured Limnohabitans sp.]
MTRLSLLLLIATVTSALWLVHSHYESRRMFMALETARQESKRLAVDQDRLDVERRAQAAPLRVEKIARQQLQMRAASPAITRYVSGNGALDAVSTSIQTGAAK